MIGLNFGVGNIKQTPGIITDVIANRPLPLSNVIANGTIFISTDTGEIFSFDTISQTWVNLGSTGGTQGIDSVLTTDNNLYNQQIIRLNTYDFGIGGGIFDLGLIFTQNQPFNVFNNTVRLGFNENFQVFYKSSMLNNPVYKLLLTGISGTTNGIDIRGDKGQISIGNFGNGNGYKILIDDFNSDFKLLTGIGTNGINISNVETTSSFLVQLGNFSAGVNTDFSYMQFIPAVATLFSQNFELNDSGTGNFIANTAGGASGKHLNIRINGFNYKIALLNP